MRKFGRLHVVLIHRYVGLCIALFLVIAALTGSILAFREDIDAWLAPELFVAHSGANASVLDPFVLRERVQQQLVPQARTDAVIFHLQAGTTARFPVAPNPDPSTGKFFSLDYDEVFVDPHTGLIQGSRAREAFSLKPSQLMPLVFHIHHALALPGVWGTLLLGVISLLWTIDCFVGAYLTLPKGRPFLQKWQPAWLIKRGAGNYRLMLDWHRAGGLWLWMVLLLFAWSSVMFNLRDSVYRPVMGTIFSFDDSWRSVPMRERPVITPQLDWTAAHAKARIAMEDMAVRTGFTINREERLSLDRRRGVYAYMVLSSADLRSDKGNTAILIDADTGQPLGHWLPTGGNTGNTVSNWLGALHMAHVFGLPYRIFVFFLGSFVVVLSFTGVVIWLKKKRGRQMANKGRQRALD